MSWPLAHEFNEAIQNPRTAFSDPDLRLGETVTGPSGIPLPRSGNFADVYRVRSADGRNWAVKCFTRPVTGLGDRYAKIHDALRRANLPFTVEFRYLAEGIRVAGAWRPVVKMEWIEGTLLSEVACAAAADPPALLALTQGLIEICQRNRAHGFAHGDIQHGNVLRVRGEKGDALKLVDYDGMWVPALAKVMSGESGHQAFQHPQRTGRQAFSANVDRFPFLVVATALRGLALGGRALWDRYDTGDNLLFTENDFKHPKKSNLLRDLWQTGDPGVQALAGRLAAACAAPLHQTPWLDNIAPRGEPIPLDRHGYHAASEALGIPIPVPARVPAPATAPVPARSPAPDVAPPTAPAPQTKPERPQPAQGSHEPKPAAATHARVTATATAPRATATSHTYPERKAGEVVELEIAPGVKMAFCWIPPGRAELGAPADEHEELARLVYDGQLQPWMTAEATAFRPTFVTNGFWLGKYEVTQQEWAAVTGQNPSTFNGKNPNGAKGLGTARFPVENVSWHDCHDFIFALNERAAAATARLGAPSRFTLPHENQWEYACRGGLGNDRPFCFGHMLNGEQANVDATRPWGRPGAHGFRLGRTAQVGSYAQAQPHPWGLCDMHGNVSEWCENAFAERDAMRVARGGGWDSPPWHCRSASRLRADPKIPGPGLRVCMRLAT